jgi:hypothetical protein
MPAAVRFDPLDVAVRITPQQCLEVQVLNAAGPNRPASLFQGPWTPETCTAYLERVQNQASRDLRPPSASSLDGASASLDQREMGEELFQSLFGGEIGRLLDLELTRLAAGEAASAGGLRLRLFFDLKLADIAALPWELLYHPRRREFLGRNPTTVLSRCLPIDRSATARPIRPPLKVVIVAPAPACLVPLGLAQERDFIREGLKAYRAVEVCEVQPPTLERLVEVLDGDPGIHVLHFMGHGSFKPGSGEGVLIFEGPRGKEHPVTGEALAAQLTRCSALQLVVLNCCKSGRVPRQRGQDPFTGVATALLLAGIPAVVAMQLAIPDSAALAFSGKLYSSLAAGDPVDVATTLGRLAIFRQTPRSLMWISPVLYLQVADGRILIPEEPSPQRFVLHVLLLGDAAEEAATLEKVICDFQPRLEPLRISLLAQRLSAEDPERETPDLRIVLWPGRTAVPESTLARVAEALDRDSRSGLLLHTQAPRDGSPLAELLRRHRELSCPFNGLADLAGKFRRHLLLSLFDETVQPAASLAVTEPPWASYLDRRLNESDGGSAYLDRSARRMRDRLQRLDRIFDLGTALSRPEAEVLWAAASLRLLAGAGSPSELALDIGLELDWTPELTRAAGSAAEAVEPGFDLTNPALRTGPWRVDLLAGLLRLGEILDLDRQAVSPLLAMSMPKAEADISDWLVYLTREVRTERGGIVQYVLDVPSTQWIDPLKGATSLRLEALWQDLRALFLKARLSLAVAPSEVLLGAVGKPPDSVLGRLRRFGKAVGTPRVRLRHLGEFSAGLPAILPLPNSATEGEELLAPGFEGPMFLEVKEEASGCVILVRPVSWDEREVVLDFEDLRPDRWYCWCLYSENQDGNPHELLRLGRLRPLSPRQRLFAQAVPPGHPDSRRALLALGLRTRVLREVIPALESGQASQEDAQVAYRLVLDAYDWVIHEAPDCSLVDSYRNAAVWIEPLLGETP